MGRRQGHRNRNRIAVEGSELDGPSAVPSRAGERTDGAGPTGGKAHRFATGGGTTVPDRGPSAGGTRSLASNWPDTPVRTSSDS